MRATLYDRSLALKRYAPRPDAPAPAIPHTSFISTAFDDVDYDDVLAEIGEVARLTLDDGFD
jgi:hypothetical protein